MADSQGLVTVVVSVYNIETLLPRCLAAISAQTYSNLEILLIDDGSTDGSGRICDEFATTDPRVRVIHQVNQGIWAVRNKGVKEARGEYVAFPDGDDYFHKDYIRLLYEAINLGGEKYPMSVCDFRRVRDCDGDTGYDAEPLFEVMDQQALMDQITLYPSCGSTLWGANWNKLYRKSTLPEPFQKPYRRCQDFDSNLRVFAHVDKAVYVHEVLYYWVQWSGQSTRSRDDEEIRDECRSRIYLDHYLTLPRELSNYQPFLLVNLYRRLIVWKECARGTDRIKKVSADVRRIERKTFASFLTCKRLPFRRRLRWLLCLDMPSLLGVFGRKITLEKA